MEFNSTDDVIVSPPSSTMTSDLAENPANSSQNSRCGNLDEDYMIVWNAFQWWCEGIFFTGIGLVRLFTCLGSIEPVLPRQHICVSWREEKHVGRDRVLLLPQVTTLSGNAHLNSGRGRKFYVRLTSCPYCLF